VGFTPVSSERVNKRNGVATPTENGPKSYRKSKPSTSIPTNPERGVSEKDSVFAAMFVNPKEKLPNEIEAITNIQTIRDIFFITLTPNVYCKPTLTKNYAISILYIDLLEIAHAYAGKVLC
jgi:hypothetical protein